MLVTVGREQRLAASYHCETGHLKINLSQFNHLSSIGTFYNRHRFNLKLLPIQGRRGAKESFLHLSKYAVCTV